MCSSIVGTRASQIDDCVKKIELDYVLQFVLISLIGLVFYKLNYWSSLVIGHFMDAVRYRWENTGFAIYDSTDQWGFTTLKSEIITRRPKYVLDLTSSESELDYEPNIEVTPSAKVISMDKSTFPNSKLNSLKKLDSSLNATFTPTNASTEKKNDSLYLSNINREVGKNLNKSTNNSVRNRTRKNLSKRRPSYMRTIGGKCEGNSYQFKSSTKSTAQLTSGQMLTSNGSDNDDTVKHFDQKNENKSVVTSSVRTEENKFTKKSAVATKLSNISSFLSRSTNRQEIKSAKDKSFNVEKTSNLLIKIIRHKDSQVKPYSVESFIKDSRKKMRNRKMEKKESKETSTEIPSQDSIASDDLVNTFCALCRNDFKKRPALVSNPCAHMFCLDCVIDQMLIPNPPTVELITSSVNCKQVRQLRKYKHNYPQMEPIASAYDRDKLKSIIPWNHRVCSIKDKIGFGLVFPPINISLSCKICSGKLLGFYEMIKK